MEKKEALLIINNFNNKIQNSNLYERAIEELGPDEFYNLVEMMNELLFLNCETEKKYSDTQVIKDFSRNTRD